MKVRTRSEDEAEEWNRVDTYQGGDDRVARLELRRAWRRA
jgi:hypothetical protein